MIIEKFPGGAGPARKATLFFTGWGMDAAPFRAAFPKGRDCIVCHDYSHLDFDPECVRRYDEVLVVAWSMGVWAAAHVLTRYSLRCAAAIAVNGTMHPIDDQLGIPRDVFAGTLAGLTPSSLAKFQRRMCASPESHSAFLSAPPRRDFADCLRELGAIVGMAGTGTEAPPMRWDCAVISSKDRIFPPANQLRAWDGSRVIQVKDGHFLASWEAVLDGRIAR